MKTTITFDKTIKTACPNQVSGVITCTVTNSKINNLLWEEISTVTETLRSKIKIEEVKNIKTISATRAAYKACGKDPNRYRPSAEQLNRRILQGKSLYQISTLVDLVNLVSVKSGYSIGGFDADKIQGNLDYGIGQPNEVYNGIGRGLLNIEGIPILRDTLGGIGTPTSDEERTMLSLSTTRFLMNINAFDGDSDLLQDTIKWSVELLEKYVDAQDIEVHFYK